MAPTEEPQNQQTNENNTVPPSTPEASSEQAINEPTIAADATPVATVSTTPGAKSSKTGRKKLLFIIALVALVLLLAGGFVFGYYLPNKPENVYKSGLTNTAKGYDKLVNYIEDQQKQKYQGAEANGSFKLTASSVSGEGTFSSQSSGGNSTGKVDLNISGQKFSANFRSIQPNGQSTPDIYLQLTGIKSTLDSYGLNSLDTLDGQWIAIDHTLLDGIANMGKDNPAQDKVSAPTQAQIEDAMKKAGEVNRQYIFTTDPNKAVLQNKKYLGKSTQDGRSVYGYQVGYSKPNLKAYVKALGTALDSSSLNGWAKQVNEGKSISDSMNIPEINKSIDAAKADYTFTMYIDAGTKLIRQLHFTDPSDPTNNYFNVGLQYTGGDEYPFVLELHAKDGKDKGNGKLTLTLNTATNKLSLELKSGGSVGDTPFSFTLNFAVTPTNKDVKVTAPTGAKPIMELLNSFNLGGLLGGSSSSSPIPTTIDDSGLLFNQ